MSQYATVPSGQEMLDTQRLSSIIHHQEWPAAPIGFFPGCVPWDRQFRTITSSGRLWP
jgi:hypothetical protein